MIQFQMSFTDFAFILFLPMVFIGAFFLVNLLLAVINSSFSIKNKELQRKIQAEKEQKKQKKKAVVTEDEMMKRVLNEDDDNTDIGIQQYWISKRVAHRMII